MQIHKAAKRLFLLCITLIATALGGAVAARETSVIGEMGGFHVLFALSSDSADVLAKAWQAPRTTPFWFKVLDADAFPAGDKFTLFFLVSGMKATNGKAKVQCDVSVTFSNGTRQSVDAGICYDSKMNGPKAALYISRVWTLGFPADLKGEEVVFNAVVTDVIGNASVPLEMKIQLTGR